MKNNIDNDSLQKIKIQLCPLIRDELPSRPCPYALKSIIHLRDNQINQKIKAHLSTYTILVDDDDACEWFIIDEKSHYCFFLYWANPANIKDYTQEEIVDLLGITVGMVCITEQKAILKLKDSTHSFYDLEFIPRHSVSRYTFKATDLPEDGIIILDRNQETMFRALINGISFSRHFEQCVQAKVQFDFEEPAIQLNFLS